MFYIYKFLNQHERPIYIGITGDIETKIKLEHFGGSGLLLDECYAAAYMVLYSECVSEDDAKIKERYFINMQSPKYNKKLNDGRSYDYFIGELEWIYMPIDKDSFKKSRLQKQKNKIEYQNITLDHQYLSYDSLKSGPFKLFKKIPCKTTTLLEDYSYNTNRKLNTLSINNSVWMFLDQIYRFIDNNSSKGNITNTIRLINESHIELSSFCITNDVYLIKDNVKSRGIDIFARKLYPKAAVLVAFDAVKKILEHIISVELKPYVDQLVKKGMITKRGHSMTNASEEVVFYLLNDFVEFSESNNTFLGRKLKLAKKIQMTLDAFIL